MDVFMTDGKPSQKHSFGASVFSKLFVSVCVYFLEYIY